MSRWFSIGQRRCGTRAGGFYPREQDLDERSRQVLYVGIYNNKRVGTSEI
jgi:hypothetical protein